MLRNEIALAMEKRVTKAVLSIQRRLNCTLIEAHQRYNDTLVLSPSWITRFMDQAALVASWSKDPSTQCGAVIVDKKNRVVSTGFNGFPQKFPDKLSDYIDRDRKYSLIVHSEINAIIFADKSLDDCVLFSYPMIPCCRCAAAICQTGIKLVVFPELDEDLGTRWAESEKLSKELFQSCGVKTLEIPSDYNVNFMGDSDEN